MLQEHPHSALCKISKLQIHYIYFFNLFTIGRCINGFNEFITLITLITLNLLFVHNTPTYAVQGKTAINSINDSFSSFQLSQHYIL